MLVVSMLMGNLAYANNNFAIAGSQLNQNLEEFSKSMEKPIESMSVGEKQKRLSQLQNVREKANNKVVLIEKFYKTGGFIARPNHFVGVAALAIISIIAFRYSVSRHKNDFIGYSAAVSYVLSGVAAIYSGSFLIASLPDSEFYKVLQNSSDEERAALYNDLKKLIEKIDQKSLELENSLMAALK